MAEGREPEHGPNMGRDQWVLTFCRRIGIDPPSPEEIGALLKLAATAAHTSERPAAPLACWAAGRSGRSAADLQQIADSIAPAPEAAQTTRSRST